MEKELFNKNLQVFVLFTLASITGLAFATDYSVTSSTSSQIVFGANNDTLTVSGAGSINYGSTKTVNSPSRSGVTITNAGTISGTDDTIYLSSSNNATITNTGTISSSDATITLSYSDGGTITNTGTITGANYTINLCGSDTTITNSGAITSTGRDGLYLACGSVVTLNNTGTITGSRYGIGNYVGNWSADPFNVVIVNTGTIDGGSSDINTNYPASFASLTNDQGGSDALKVRLRLPTSYILKVNSTSDYGKLDISSPYGVMNFSIDSSSTLAVGTYNDVILNLPASKISGGQGSVTTSGGTFYWTLNEYQSDDWNLVIATSDTTAPNFSSRVVSAYHGLNYDVDTDVDTNIVLNFDENVDVETGNITIKRYDGSTIETISLPSSQVTGSGTSQITVNPSSSLPSHPSAPHNSSVDQVYFTIDATAFDDASGNSFAGLTDSNKNSVDFRMEDTNCPHDIQAVAPTNVTFTSNCFISMGFKYNPSAGGGTVTINSGATIYTMSGYPFSFSAYGGNANLVNNGTLQAGNAGVQIGSNVNSIINTGTIGGGSSYGALSLWGSPTITSITNTGTLLKTGSKHHIYNDYNGTITTINNDQGQSGSDPVTLLGTIPTNYNVIINSPSDYGKIEFVAPAWRGNASATTTFGVHSSSTLAAGTYSAVITGLTSGRFAAGTSGTFNSGALTWVLNNSSGTIWDLVVSNVGPTVSSVSSDKSAGSYKVGEAININILFSSSVNVTGTPQITLETGSTDRVINYSSGSSSNTLTFVYTVQAGDTASDLDYISTSALALNGGTIRDSSSNNATLTLPTVGGSGSLGSNEALVIDTVVPSIAITSSTVSDGATSNNSTIAMIFTSSEATTNFVHGDITVVGGSLSSLSGSGTTYTATFTPAG